MSEEMKNEVMGHEIGWEDEIENDGKEFIVLPEGDYDFEVIGFERGRFPGSAKLPACNKAVLKLVVHTDKGDTYITQDLIMFSTLDWKISEFLVSIGQKKKGEKVKPNWNAMVGATGRAKIKVRHWENKEKGTSGDSNDIEKFYPKEELPFVEGDF